MGFATENIRNLAIVGHGGTGKTTLTEHLLFAGGAIAKPETVESGRTVSDYLDAEVSQRISIKTAFTHSQWNGQKVNILDTPGAADFVGEVILSLRVCETVVVVIGAKAGVQIETAKLWRRLDQRNKPRLVFVNRMDEERADFDAVVADLRERYKRPIVPVVFPLGAAGTYAGVVDVIAGKAFPLPPAGEKEKSGEVPADARARLEEYRQAMIEAAAEGDEDLMNKYLESGTLTPEEMLSGLRKALAANKVVPVLCGSATKHSGISAFLDFVALAAPSPAATTEIVVDGENQTPYPVKPDGSFGAFCCKTSIDQFSGQLSFLKVVRGRLGSDTDVVNQREGKKERIGKIFFAQGKKLLDASEVLAGDLCVLAKLAYTHTNDSLCSPDDLVHFAHLALPQPIFSLAVSCASKKDEDKLSQMLQRAAEEDKTFGIAFNPETKQTVISGMGELHLNMILGHIKETQRIEVETTVPRVAYRETITKASEATYRHKKQSGGHGQFAEVAITAKPLPRGEHYAFENIIKGMAVSKSYIPGIEKGLHEAMESGVLASYPVMDVSINLTDGKEHPVDSSEMAFKIAAREALKAAMGKAGPVLLEPIMNLSVVIEEQYLGDVLSDLSSRRGKVLGQDQLGGGISEVKAQVPQAELLRYAIDLKALTSGTGTFEVDFDHYSPVTGKTADDVIKATQEARAAEAAHAH